MFLAQLNHSHFGLPDAKSESLSRSLFENIILVCCAIRSQFNFPPSVL